MKKKLVAEFAGLATLALLVAWWVTSCSDSLDQVKTISADPPPPVTCDGIPLGTTEVESCPVGQTGSRLTVCTENGWELANDSCISACDSDSQNKVTFNQDIKPIMVNACIRCHSTPERYDEYEVARGLGDAIIQRVNLPASDLKRMPRSPLPELSVEQKGLLEQWRNDGYLEKSGCAPRDSDGGEFLNLDLDYIETQILNDLNRLDSQSQVNSRYLILSHKYNAKKSGADMDQFRNGIHKSLNSLSTAEDLLRASPIDSRRTIYRVDLNAYDFGLDSPNDDRNDWQAVVDVEPFKFESFTNKGLQIKALTGVDIPWLHGDNYTFTAHDESDIYYEILDLPATRDDLFAQLGVDFQADFDNFDVTMAGFFGSPISLNKNRMISRHESRDGYLWVTYDPDDLGGAERNYFEFPLLAESNGEKIALFDAQEMIFTLPNGMQGYYLSNGDGLQQAEAPITVVTDTDSPFNPIIVNAISCHRCHTAGLLQASDQIRQSAIANASEFTANDLELIKAYFKPNGALSATFTSDNALYSKYLGELGIDIGNDNLNFLTDDFRRDLLLIDAASFVFFTPQQMKDCINSSAALKATIGQLLTGGAVGLQQFIASFPDIIIDCRLGQDPVDQ